MRKINKFWNYLFVALFCLSLTSGTAVFAASPAKQLARGIAFYEDNKNDEALDCFIDVMVSGNRDQVAEANKYVELIHNRMGGIQTPVEVDINFKEGEVKSLDDITAESIRAAQEQASAEAAEAVARANAMKAEAEARAEAAKNNALAEVDAQQQALTQRIETNRLAAQERAAQIREGVIQETADWNEAAIESSVVNATVGAAGLSATAQADVQAVDAQTQYQIDVAKAAMAADAEAAKASADADAAAAQANAAADAEAAQANAAADAAAEADGVLGFPPEVLAGLKGGSSASKKPVSSSTSSLSQSVAASTEAEQSPYFSQEPAPVSSRPEVVLTASTSGSETSAFADLTSPDAIEARNTYTRQKLDSMTAAAIERISSVKGIHLYLKNGMPDALDMDADVIFKGNKFRTESLPLLDDIYELMALTQNAAYVILPAGSYTDDVTLSGIRQAMALNSYFINRGISQGKLHYNMGLVDQEPPARFANLNGLSIVFDYSAQLPTRLEKNEGNEKAPLLSMAIVPQCHALDRSLGEAYAIDFSVLETLNPVDNWMLQIVQHGRDGKYYVVRQLEGFTPVYHQILWNGRKGIIGPELPCGKYTLVLTATDLKGQKQTLRRRVVVKCTAQKAKSSAKCTTGSCQVSLADEQCPNCNYKAKRLWKKPTRFMKAPLVEETTDTAMNAGGYNPQNPYAAPSAMTDQPDTLGATANNNPYAPMPTADPYAAPQGGTAQPSAAPADLPVNNPYDMPYEQYGN